MKQLSDYSVASVICNMKEWFDFDMTTDEVQAIVAKQNEHFFEIIGDDGISDTLPRGYWLDAIAREWAGREYWPANMDPPDPTFATDLVAGYKRKGRVPHMIDTVDPLLFALVIGFVNRPPRSSGPRPAIAPRPQRHSEPSWHRIIGLVAVAVALAMMMCVWLAPQHCSPY